MGQQTKDSKFCESPISKPEYVYVRRKLKSMSARSNISNNQCDHNLNRLQLSPVLCSNILNQQLEERYINLQTIIIMLNQSNLHDYTETLMRLPSVELSRIAFELEKRSIQLSLEEAKELIRAEELDVLEKFSKHTTKSIHDT